MVTFYHVTFYSFTFMGFYPFTIIKNHPFFWPNDTLRTCIIGRVHYNGLVLTSVDLFLKFKHHVVPQHNRGWGQRNTRHVGLNCLYIRLVM